MKSDTTGCGDNFSGGVISSLVTQMISGDREGFDLVEACSWGIASGTYTGLITGGTEFEKQKGEKLEKITRLYKEYKKDCKRMMRRKILIFGAGKIGRAFIGQVFGRAGYEVVFVDIDRGIIDQLNQKRQYRVEIKDQVCETLIIKNVSGVQADDLRGIKRELMECDLVAVSVGQSGMPAVAVCLAEALEHKYHEAPHRATISSCGEYEGCILRFCCKAFHLSSRRLSTAGPCGTDRKLNREDGSGDARRYSHKRSPDGVGRSL